MKLGIIEALPGAGNNFPLETFTLGTEITRGNDPVILGQSPNEIIYKVNTLA